MKVIEIGNEKSEKWIGRCKNCNSLIEANTDELKQIIRGGRYNEMEEWAYEDCIQCHFGKSVCFHRENTPDAKYDILNKKGK